MSVGIWITPALLAGLFLILWVTTRLERLVTPPDLAPEFGNGGQYSSTMLAGGLSRDLVWMHKLRITALVGYASYTETPNTAARSIRGPSFGGMVSIPLLGPVRLAYRGQYVKGPSKSNVTRYSVGLIF